MRVLSLFDGISCGRLALGDCVTAYYASEIDSKALEVTAQNWPETIQLGDVTKLKALPEGIDLLIGGSPCQSFSQAGLRTGFEGKSGLFWEYVRVLKELKPKYFLLENVKMKAEWRNIITDALGVSPALINSNVFGCQNRPRYYWFNWDIPELPNDQSKTIQESLGLPPSARFYTERRTEEAKRIRREFQKLHGRDFSPRRGKELVLREDCFSNCLTATESQREHRLFDGTCDRMCTAEEWEIIQSLPAGYTSAGGTSTARKKMIGNGWHVDTLRWVFQFCPLVIAKNQKGLLD